MINLPTKAMGGSEQQYFGLYPHIPTNINVMLNNFNIDPSKFNIHWQHQYHDQPSVQQIRNKDTVDNLNTIVFVQHHQKQLFEMYHNIPHEKSVVIYNQIHPFGEIKKSLGKVNLIYTSTPFRGLNILVASLMMLLDRTPSLRDVVHLDVFQNMNLYGADYQHLNVNYEDIYKICQNHPNISYHGVVPPIELRGYLENAHIMAYPCIWEETFCISVVEAMAAGVIPVISDIGALPEICNSFATYYSPVQTDIYNPDKQHEHVIQYSYILEQAIIEYLNELPSKRISAMRNFVDYSYSWNNNLKEWRKLFSYYGEQ